MSKRRKALGAFGAVVIAATATPLSAEEAEVGDASFALSSDEEARMREAIQSQGGVPVAVVDEAIESYKNGDDALLRSLPAGSSTELINLAPDAPQNLGLSVLGKSRFRSVSDGGTCAQEFHSYRFSYNVHNVFGQRLLSQYHDRSWYDNCWEITGAVNQINYDITALGSFDMRWKGQNHSLTEHWHLKYGLSPYGEHHGKLGGDWNILEPLNPGAQTIGTIFDVYADDAIGDKLCVAGVRAPTDGGYWIESYPYTCYGA